MRFIAPGSHIGIARRKSAPSDRMTHQEEAIDQGGSSTPHEVGAMTRSGLPRVATASAIASVTIANSRRYKTGEERKGLQFVADEVGTSLRPDSATVAQAERTTHHDRAAAAADKK